MALTTDISTIHAEISDLFFHIEKPALQTVLDNPDSSWDAMAEAIREEAYLFVDHYPDTCAYWEVTAPQLIADFLRRL